MKGLGWMSGRGKSGICILPLPNYRYVCHKLVNLLTKKPSTIGCTKIATLFCENLVACKRDKQSTVFCTLILFFHLHIFCTVQNCHVICLLKYLTSPPPP
jgi:hypothetical protein